MEAYRIAIGIHLVNRVSPVLGLLMRDFERADASAVKLKKTLEGIKLMGMAGAAIGAAGFLGLRALERSLKPARDYAHQLNIMNMAGLKQVEIAESVKKAWDISSQVKTTTVTENLKSILDLRNVLSGGLQEALHILPQVAKMQAVLESSKEGIGHHDAHDMAFSMAKALDIRGAAADPRDPGRFMREAAEMFKSVTALQGRVDPKMFQSVFSYARQAKFGIGEEFAYEFLPTLMLSHAIGSGGQGGGSRGVGPMLSAVNSFFVQGMGLNKLNAPYWEKLGLIENAKYGRGGMVGGSVITGGTFRGAALADKNPFLFEEQVIRPALQKLFPGMEGDKGEFAKARAFLIKAMRGNKLAADAMLEYLTQATAFYRDQKNIQGAMSYSDAWKVAMEKDPELAFKAAAAQWTKLQMVLGNEILPLVIPMLHKLADGLHAMSEWAEKNPGATHDLVLAFAGLSTALAFSGTVLTLAWAFRGLAAILDFLSGRGLLKAAGVIGDGAATAEIATEAGGAAAAVSSLSDGFRVLAGAAVDLFARIAPLVGLFIPSTPLNEGEDEAVKKRNEDWKKDRDATLRGMGIIPPLLGTPGGGVADEIPAGRALDMLTGLTRGKLEKFAAPAIPKGQTLSQQLAYGRGENEWIAGPLAPYLAVQSKEFWRHFLWNSQRDLGRSDMMPMPGLPAWRGGSPIAAAGPSWPSLMGDGFGGGFVPSGGDKSGPAIGSSIGDAILEKLNGLITSLQVALSAQVTLNGDVHFDGSGLEGAVGRIVARGLAHASNGTATGGRVDTSGGPIAPGPPSTW